MRLAVQTSPRNPYASALRANNAGIWARCSAVNLAGPPGRGWVRSASTPFSRARLSHWHTAAQLTPSAAAMSFCHQPCWDNSQARWRRHSQESARRLDVLMPPAARQIHALTPTSVVGPIAIGTNYAVITHLLLHLLTKGWVEPEVVVDALVDAWGLFWGDGTQLGYVHTLSPDEQRQVLAGLRTLHADAEMLVGAHLIMTMANGTGWHDRLFQSRDLIPRL